MQGVNPLVLRILQVLPDELDRLQVPHYIPDFFELALETKCGLEACLEDCLEMQEQMH